VIGGSDAELRLLLCALDALAERLEVAGRGRPPLLDEVHRHLISVLGRPEPSNHAGQGSGVEDGVMLLSPLLLSYQQAAVRLGTSVSTVEREVRAGRIAVVQVGRSVRILPDELERFVAALPARRPVSPERVG
jgi:excisionase family DNA binding protein